MSPAISRRTLIDLVKSHGPNQYAVTLEEREI